ncbi:hypothetical protein [Bifidobacterium tissieri]|uniref:Uncharacterized protein n=1 Tax=Bifidobacterium tissieri TaxID=1630162 RepID=A0A5M9ZH00_9BIFI|nr:hypothetical protein [Bifidobacterium tissieri]KAA8826887.1 hypothetical protein EMO89_11515 [Bifidobacterium tissieri]KAA8831921.1 hypothetical protein EM849_06715 [Bifidobacterium tissieri]
MARGAHAHARQAKADQPQSHLSDAEREDLEGRIAVSNYHNKNVLLALIFPIMIVAKLMVLFILPDKYFFDNNRILNMVNGTAGDDAWWSGSYAVATNMFIKLNVLDFTTMAQWTIMLGMMFSVLVFAMVLRANSPDLLQTLFILATVGLLNIYVFNIGKDIIQFAFFFAVYVILVLPIENSVIKVVGSAMVLYFESTFYREYYILIAALVLGVYAILLFFRSRRQLGLGSLGWIIALMFAMIYAMMIVAKAIMPDEYNQIIGLRAGYSVAFGEDNGGNMNTAIHNWIPGGGLPIFMVNYVINLVRMMLPFELAIRGASYLPFFAFQLMVTAYMVNLLRKINQVEDSSLFIAICVFLGYVLASALFEPDFGSWTRHESATFPVLLLLILNPLQRVPITKEERMLAGTLKE